jgi:hypothetical protein
MPRILVVTGVTNFDHIRAFTSDMQFAFEMLGCTTKVIDTARPLPRGYVRQVLGSFRPDWIFSFNALGFHLEREPGVAIESSEIPFFTFMVDDPSYHLHWLDFLRRPNVYSSFGNPQAVAQARTLGVSAKNCCRMLLGAHAAPLAKDEERVHDILLVGTMADPNAIYAAIKQQLSASVLQLFDALCEIWRDDLTQSPARILEQLLAQLGLELPDAERWQLEAMILGNANRFVRNSERLRIMRHFQHLPLTIFGEGWQEVLPEAKFKFLPEISYYQSLEELCRTKIALNVQPLSYWGIGERAWNAAANGSALVCTRNALLDGIFTPGEEYIPFHLDEPALEEAATTMQQLLSNAALRREMTERARAKVLARHTWTHRAQDILGIMGCSAELAPEVTATA